MCPPPNRRSIPARPSILVRLVFLPILVLGGFADDLVAAKLRPETATAWDRYFALADAKVQRELRDPNRFLIEDYLAPSERAAIRSRLSKGEVVVERMRGVEPPGQKVDIPDAAVHHWWGAILVPGVTLDEILRFVKDYDHHAGRFVEVQQSKLLRRSGETYTFLFRLKRTKVITVHYNTEQVCSYRSHGPKRASSRSVATRIAEIDDAGTPHEREKPIGDDYGFLWRLVSWWRFEQTSEGVIVECESASLSRSIPYLFRPFRSFTESIPRESLVNTLTAIRTHVRPKGSR